MNPVINRRPFIISLSSIMLIMIAALGLVLVSMPREKTISPGISVNGQYVGGLTGSQAEELLKQRFEGSSKTGRIKLQSHQKKWVINYDQIGLTYDYPATVQKALRTVNEDSFPGKVMGMVKTYFERPNLAISYDVDYDDMNRILVDIGAEIDISAQNASICNYYGKIRTLPAVTGRTLNINSTRQKIEDAMGRPKINQIIVLDVETHQPELTSDDLKGINTLIGQGRTTTPPVKKMRYAALKSAAAMLNGILIKPGSEFSFNTAVGQGLRELTYHYGIVIQRDGQPVLANSGGTSQAASTLHQAVLNAGLKVTERNSHSIPPAGILPGQDAAVAIGKLDYKFENNTKYPVYIMAEIKDNQMIVDLMGVKI